jgi:ligand-binding sensor domain-containing protein/sensor histidine kinase YesM
MLCVLMMLQLFSAVAQQPDIVFHHITQNEGLSYNLVNCFLKDSKGMLWIGTYNGLNKYDGAHFYVYHSSHTKNTLPSNSVHKLAEDKNGNIWGGTDNGVFCLDTKTGQFKSYRTPNQKKWPAVYNLYCDKEGRIWATNNFCLSVFNEKSGSFELPPVIDGYYPEGIIRKNGLAESPDGNGFWLATGKGLQYYSKPAKKYMTGNDKSDSSLINSNNASALCKTPYGHYWYTDNITKTIIGFDPVSRKIKYRIKADSTEQVADGATLFEDKNHILWFCNWRYELFMIDYQHGNKIKPIRHNDDDVTSIAGDFFWEVMQESDGTLWFGTVGGISKSNPSRSFYKVHHLPAEVNTTKNPAINFVGENPLDKTWWIGTTKQILVHYNPVSSKTYTYELEKFIPDKNKKKPEEVYRMIFLKDSVLLFSHNGAWIKRGNNFLPLSLPAPFSNWLLRDAVLYKQRILYCTSVDKLLRWDLQTGKLDSLAFAKPFIGEGNDLYLGVPCASSSGKVWMLNSKNWLTYTDGNELKSVKMNYQDSSEADDGFFTAMAMDRKGDLWMPKKGDGLIYYNPSKNISKQFKQVDGLVMDHIMAVANDGDGRIWSACFNEFSVFNSLLNSFYNFTVPVSTNNNAYINFMAPLQNGNIITSIAGDIVEFYTAKLKAPHVKDRPLISMLAVNGVDTNFYSDKQLQLLPGENSLRIKFGMLTDNVVTPYDMLYILEGTEKNWSIAAVNFEATYNSLPSGDYTFKVKALAKDKSWQTGETVLQIHIATPFYKAWWFSLLLSFVVIATIIITYRYRIAQKEKMMELESKAQLLEKEKALVMYENLKQHLNPHFLFNSLTSLSSLIRIDAKMASNFLDKMSKVYRYILKNRDNEVVLLGEEIKFVQLYNDLQRTRFENALQIHLNIDEDYYHRKIAPVTLQNLVENAIKHNTADIETPLIIELFVENDYLVVRNNLQRKNFVETSNKQGLGNMESLYKYLSKRTMVIDENENYFIVKIPLI